MFAVGSLVFIRSQQMRGRVCSSFAYGPDGRMGTGYTVRVEGKGIGAFHENDLEPVRVLRLVVDNETTAPMQRLYDSGLLASKPGRNPNDQPEPPRTAA